MWKKINHGGEPTKNIDKKYAIFVKSDISPVKKSLIPIFMLPLMQANMKQIRLIRTNTFNLNICDEDMNDLRIFSELKILLIF